MKKLFLTSYRQKIELAFHSIFEIHYISFTMSNLITSNEGSDTFTPPTINLSTIGYYYPSENPESWSQEEYQTKYRSLVTRIRRDREYRAQAAFFADQVWTVIAQDFASDNITLSSVFRSRPADSEEWSNIGVSITKIYQDGIKESVKIVLPEEIEDIQAYVITKITTLFGKTENSNVITLESAKDAA